jgi:F0F1-type ATP synthase assembly protein I
MTSPPEPAPDPSEQDSTAPDSTAAKPLPGALAFVGLGTTVAGCVAVGVGGGIALDAWLNTSPLLLIVGLVLGVAAAVMSVRAQVRRYL